MTPKRARPRPLAHADDPAGRGIERETLARYLARVLAERVEVLDVRRLGGGEPGLDDPKGFGYGVPLEVECRVDGRPRAFVISRTRPAQGFGHDYPADRAWQAIYGHHAYNTFPRHVRSTDVGVVRRGGEIVSLADAVEFFQLVEKADGTLYWLDLARMLSAEPRKLDQERVRALARFLATAHAKRRDEPTLYERRVRELVGHGECVMGILDSYPDAYPPFLAFRALVLAHPRWYPDLTEVSRRALLRFADRMVSARRPNPDEILAAFSAND